MPCSLLLGLCKAREVAGATVLLDASQLMLRSVARKELFAVCQTVTKALAAGHIPSFRLQSSLSNEPAELKSDQPICRFGSAFSDKPTLAQSITECVAQVKQQLGDDTQLDLCQLLVSLGHGEHLRLAPMVSSKSPAEISMSQKSLF